MGNFRDRNNFSSTLRNSAVSFMKFHCEPITLRGRDDENLLTNQMRCFTCTGENSNGREFIKQSVTSYE